MIAPQTARAIPSQPRGLMDSRNQMNDTSAPNIAREEVPKNHTFQNAASIRLAICWACQAELSATIDINTIAIAAVQDKPQERMIPDLIVQRKQASNVSIAHIQVMISPFVFVR